MARVSALSRSTLEMSAAGTSSADVAIEKEKVAVAQRSPENDTRATARLSLRSPGGGDETDFALEVGDQENSAMAWPAAGDADQDAEAECAGGLGKRGARRAAHATAKRPLLQTIPGRSEAAHVDS